MVLVSDATSAPEMSQSIKTGASELDEYRRLVADVASAADGTVIFNRSAEHAAVITENIFRCAQREVDVLTGHLHEPVYGQTLVVDAAIGFLRGAADRRINIISEDPISGSHALISAISAAGLADQVSCNTLPEPLRTSFPYHFAVADGRSFRFEPDEQKFEAIGQFGDDKAGSNLKQRFDFISGHIR